MMFPEESRTLEAELLRVICKLMILLFISNLRDLKTTGHIIFALGLKAVITNANRKNGCGNT